MLQVARELALPGFDVVEGRLLIRCSLGELLQRGAADAGRYGPSV
jgi:hypothetical protein